MTLSHEKAYFLQERSFETTMNIILVLKGSKKSNQPPKIHVRLMKWVSEHVPKVWILGVAWREDNLSQAEDTVVFDTVKAAQVWPKDIFTFF